MQRCSAFNCSCYWMINLATQLNMEPITVSGRQRVRVCVSPWSKFAAFSCRANARVHILVVHCTFSDFWLCVRVIKRLEVSGRLFITQWLSQSWGQLTFWRESRESCFHCLEILTLCCSLSTWVHLKKLWISDNESTVSVKYSIGRLTLHQRLQPAINNSPHCTPHTGANLPCLWLRTRRPNRRKEMNQWCREHR